MRPRPMPFLLLSLCTLAACGGGGGSGGGPPQGVADFLHFTTTENTTGPATRLDHPLANGNPDARIFVTHNWNPAGATGTYHDAPHFVSFDDVSGQWSIVNILGDMPTSIYFNVTIVSGFDSAWRHVATAGNIVANGTTLDHPDLNGNPTALVLATKAAPSGGGVFVMTSYDIGVVYDSGSWEVFFEHLGSSMGENTTFHVHVLPHDSASFLHVATPANISGNSTEISHPDADGNPNALIQVTKRLESGSYHEERIGVWYEGFTGHWNLYNEDSSPMPVDAAFVVRVKP